MKMTRLLYLIVATCLLSLTAGAQSVVKPKAYYDAITYTWQDANSHTVTSKLTDKATDPYQIIALLETVYGDARVPGPYYSAYGQWTNNGSWIRPNYSLDNTVRTDPVDYSSITTNGWNVTGNKPNEEGYTVLIVAVKNDFNPDVNNHRYAGSITDKAALVSYIQESVDYVQLLTDGLRMDEGTEKAGTMFAIEGNLNRFFFLSKGQARKQYHSSYILVPFSTMFEQFSPTDGQTGDNTQNLTDFYDKMVKGETYPIMHDCNSVLEVKHYFSMSGHEGTTSFDMTGLNFFIPDHRLDWWGETSKSGNRITGYSDSRDMNSSSSDAYAQYGYYNTDHLPWVFLYTIKLHATAEQEGAVADHKYQVNLSWTSSIDNLSGEHVDQVYDLYRVVDGVVEATPIATNITDTTWNEVVDQQTSGYSLSYIVKGKPKDATYKPIQSNIATVAIPGYDPLERLKLTISGDFRSTYNYDNEKNDYENTLVLNNGVGTSVNRGHLQNSPVLYLKRNVPADSTQNVVAATITISNVGTSSCSYKLEYQNQNETKQAKNGTFYFKSNGDIDFSNFTIVDNFSADVSKNEHPAKYSYQMEFTSAVPVLDENGEEKTRIYSNSIEVPIYKTTTARLPGYDYETVMADKYRPDDAQAVIGQYEAKHMGILFDVHNNPQVFRYYTTREATEYGQAQRRSDGDYVVSENTAGQMQQVTFADGSSVAEVKVPDHSYTSSGTAGLVDYRTVIETFLPNSTSTDHNTYGAQRQLVEEVDINASLVNQAMGDFTFEDKDGNTGRYYNNTIEIPVVTPEGCKLQMVRVWRKTAAGIARERTEKNNNRDYTWRLDQVGQPDVITFKEDGTIESVNFDVPNVTAASWDNLGNVLTINDVFGAIDIKDTNMKFDVDYFVRAYFSLAKSAQGAARKIPADATYTIDQAELKSSFDSNVVTSVSDITPAQKVKSVTYVNVMGQHSSHPFEGVNIVITTWDDGSTTTTKVMR